jgi:S1-C subfamily serine protease
MKKLAYMFSIALFLFGCTYHNTINISYDPIDYPPEIFSLKDKQPTLFIDPVTDNRNFALEHKNGIVSWWSGRFEEDPLLVQRFYGLDKQLWLTSKAPPEIILESLEREVRRFGIKIAKDRGLADGVLNTSIEEFKLMTFDYNIKTSVKINLKLYQKGFENHVWSGILKGNIKNVKGVIGNGTNSLNSALSMAIKQWYSYPGFQEAVVKLAENVTSPQPVVQQPSVKQQVVSGGTGFLFSAKDYVITNWHVVKGAGSILTKFTNGETIEATVVAKDLRNDIAVLKLEQSSPLHTKQIKLGDSSQARMGEKIFTIGYPASKIMGEKPKYSEGVINAMTGLKDDPAFFQVSLPVQPGNSGGPLFNERGEVIGITTASLSPLAMDTMGTTAQNVNYAIKSSFLKNLLSTIPELMLSNTGIVVVANKPEKSLPNFIEQISNNIVLIEAKE